MKHWSADADITVYNEISRWRIVFNLATGNVTIDISITVTDNLPLSIFNHRNGDTTTKFFVGKIFLSNEMKSAANFRLEWIFHFGKRGEGKGKEKMKSPDRREGGTFNTWFTIFSIIRAKNRERSMSISLQWIHTNLMKTRAAEDSH